MVVTSPPAPGRPIPGHMNTGAVVRGFLGQQQLEEALTGMDLVIIPAGVPRKHGMTRDGLFNINAGIVKPPCSFTAREIDYLTDPIQNGGTEVVEAYVAVKFADACLRSLRGDARIVECAYVASHVTELPFFASKVRLGRSGAEEEIHPLDPINEYERIYWLNRERDRVVFQMGTSDAVRAPEAAQIVKVLDRPRDPAKWNEIADVVSALSIPVIANGDVFEYDDFERVKVARGASSVMAARGALWNASIFSPEGKADWEDVKREYVRKSVLWDNDVKSTKHTLKEMVVHYSCLEHPEGKAVIKSQSLADLAKVYGVEEYYQLVSGNRFSLDGQTA
ncbi:Malate dehydrogenase, glyoxysomal [Hibiscus syriacus]|uniref:Malate dehydrogenase, glyoxysomal n=1 Tax=Hibiscus syriacus TaxID=106335 RepID=A0A6A3A9T6_HIBSY|nr:Malate dehydrogenase, glyoxysomal [Hibiscus syriacus]